MDRKWKSPPISEVPPDSHKDKREIVDRALQEAVLHAEKVGMGRDALVFRFTLKDIPEPDLRALDEEGIHLAEEKSESAALKVLKIYRPGEGVREHQIQEEAYEVLNSVEGVAKIPQPMGLRDQHIDDSVRSYLNDQGGHLDTEMEVVVMEFIPGKDVATIMYEFALSKMGFEPSVLETMTFEAKNAAVASRLGFVEGRNTSGDEGAKQFAELVALNENGRKLVRFLKKHGFSLPLGVVDKVEKGLQLLHAKGIKHNDMHERNVMIREDGEVFIIDFGRSKKISDEHQTDDFSIIRRWKELVMSPEEEARLETARKQQETAHTVTRIETNPAWQAKMEAIARRMRSDGASALEREFLLVRGNDRAFEQLASACSAISKTHPDLRDVVLTGIRRFLDLKNLRHFEQKTVRDILQELEVKS